MKIFLGYICTEIKRIKIWSSNCIENIEIICIVILFPWHISCKTHINISFELICACKYPESESTKIYICMSLQYKWYIIVFFQHYNIFYFKKL